MSPHADAVSNELEHSQRVAGQICAKSVRVVHGERPPAEPPGFCLEDHEMLLQYQGGQGLGQGLGRILNA
eukprot:1674532-Amphidinium_carterae.3